MTATFPALVPSSRTYTPGDYPNTAFKAFSGIQNRVRHSNVMLQSTLKLAFSGLTEAQMLSILTHYKAVFGNYDSFDIPSDLWSGVSVASDYTLTNYRWRYANAPTVNDLPCGNHIVEITLESIPPEGIAAQGINSRVFWKLTNGPILVSNGITSTINVSLAAGFTM